jgi:serine phosphatase RsbU (regulator of sigma subunit)
VRGAYIVRATPAPDRGDALTSTEHRDGTPDSPSIRAEYEQVFAWLPTAYLLMSADLRIVDANHAYTAMLKRERSALVGREVFEAFPPAESSLDADGTNPLRASFERVRDTGQLEHLPLLNYDVVDPVSGVLERRFWSLVSAPVPGPDGRTALILQRVEDVTEQVRDREGRRAEADRGRAAEERLELVEADLFVRAQQLTVAVRAQAVASRRLAALTGAALQLAAADSFADLVESVVGAGVRALGADGGAVGVVDPRGAFVEVTSSGSPGPPTGQRYAMVPLDSREPAAWAARTGDRVLLRDRAAGLAWSSVAAASQLSAGGASMSVPLRAGERLIGSFTVVWDGDRTFPPDEIELIEAFAAQCATALDRVQVRVADRRAAVASRQMSEVLQRSLLTEPPRPPGLEIAVRYRPASAMAQVGGDWYDAFLAEDGEATTVVIGDVTGHDRSAAAAMGQVRNVLRGVAQNVPGSAADVLTALDRSMRSLQVDTLATAVLGQVRRTGSGTGSGSGPDQRWQLQWSNAGHPPPLMLLPGGEGELLQREPDLLLGLHPGYPRSDHRVELPVGATLLLYTDGLVERRGELLDRGLQRLRTQASALADLPVEQLCDTLLAQAGDEHLDDVAMLALRVVG